VRARVWAAIAVASVGWGTGGIATRAAFHQGLGPFTIIGLRTAVAAIALFTYRLVRRRPLPNRRAWTLGGLLGLTNITAPYILFTLAVQYASAGFVGLLISNVPLVTALWAHFLLSDEKLNRHKALGLSLAAAGVVVLAAPGESGLGVAGRPGLAVSLTLAGVVVASFGGVHTRRHAPHHDVLDLAGPQFALGALVLLGCMLGIEGVPIGVTAAGWGLLIYMGLVSTFLPFMLFFWMLQRVSATKASLPSYLVPVVAVAGGVLLLGEQVSLLMGLGGVLILCGVVLTERAESRPPAAGPVAEVVP
jgi:drug/metabolite transporter (DMT)-like permease